MQGANSIYVESMYQAWKADPASVHASWQAYFKTLDAEAVPPEEAFAAPPRVLEVQYSSNLNDSNGYRSVCTMHVALHSP